jgi:outer membrane protein insertion porin family
MGQQQARRGRGNSLSKAATGAILAAAVVAAGVSSSVCAQTTQPVAPVRTVIIAPELRGRIIEDIRVTGNRLVSSSEILNVVRSKVGEKFDPETVTEDYQRVFGLRKFSNVEAKVEPTQTGVLVVFDVEERDQIESIRFIGNQRIDDITLQRVVDIQPGQSIDLFRINLTRQAIESLYRERNYPKASVDIDREALTRTGNVIFRITEGPNVRIRNIDFVGAKSFTEDRLKRQIRSKSWIWILQPGRFDEEQVEDDVGALRRYYESKGFFDARVGRKIIWSPDQSEVQINFLIDEGPRYKIDRVTFRGNTRVSEKELRERMNLLEGQPFDQQVLDRDVRQVVKAYSPFGYIWAPQLRGPRGEQIEEYLNINTKRLYTREAGKIELIYDISEGRPFRIGRIIIKGNPRSQDKLVLRELRVSPGDMYNSGELADAADRLKSTAYFAGVEMTPIGSAPDERDLLVRVQERETGLLSFGAGVNSNGGVGGNITYEQRNFDIGAWPATWRDAFSDRAFRGAGQTWRVSLEPGTEATNASVRFVEPWLFDQPYSLSTEAYLRNREREDYDENRIGGRVAIGKRFGYYWSTTLSLRGENVEIDDIEDPEVRAPDILEYEGNTTITSAGLTLRRDTVEGGFIPYKGTNTSVGVEQFGVFGGESFTKISAGWNAYYLLGEDLLDRRTTLGIRLDAGYITGDAPFFERLYGGGLGSIRGFEYRGVSPRQGPEEDRIGGDFAATGTVEIGFPIAGDNFRGVVFSDFGTVEEDFEVGTIRSSVGAGVRIILPFFGQAPLAIDFAYPLTEDDEDDTQLISFSFGIIQ